MINYVKGDMLLSPAQVLVNTVNTAGVMGKGIAKDFKRAFPEMFKHYQELCESGKLEIGKIWLYKTPHKWVLNFPTKVHWRSPSKIEYIEQGLKKLVDSYAHKGVKSIAFPQLGCGNGGLDWETQVQPVMEKYLKNLLIDIFIYTYEKPINEPEGRDTKAVVKWLRANPAEISLNEMIHDLKNLLHESTLQILGSDETFDCYIENDVEGARLRFERGGVSEEIASWQLMMLWNSIRDFGFCAEYTLPPALMAISPMLITVLARLPYLRLVQLSRTYEGLKDSTLGLQIVPPVADRGPLTFDVESPGTLVQESFLV